MRIPALCYTALYARNGHILKLSNTGKRKSRARANGIKKKKNAQPTHINTDTNIKYGLETVFQPVPALFPRSRSSVVVALYR